MNEVLNLFGLEACRVVLLKDVPLGNANWLVETADAERLVLRRYHPQATREDLAYEHAVPRGIWPTPAGSCRPRSASRCAGRAAGTA